MNRHIGIVTPFEFEDFLLISLDNKWNKVFDRKFSFKVFLDRKGRLNFVSQ